MRIALGVEYNGSGFCGWQTQPGAGAVQDRIEAACSQIAQQTIKVVCAGRTDAGVHAVGQVVHFDTLVERPLSAWVRGVNALLPPMIAVNWAHPVTDDFHARYSALARCYRYVVLNTSVRPALENARIGWCHQPLALERMQLAAEYLIGEHDFTAFRASHCQAKTPIRVLHHLRIERAGPYVIFDLRANAFLHHMVRNIVGSLIYVGMNKHPPQWLRQVLQDRQRAQAAPTFDASGLYLTQVDYAEHWQLPNPRPFSLWP